MDNNDRLNCDAVDSKPRDIDWREALGEHLEGWRSFEEVECDECGRTVVLSSLCVNEEHRYLEPEVIVTDEDGDEIEEDNECRGTLCHEGPMMNYFYPVRIDDCEEAARAIAHLPLCVVEFESGETGLALTGGGMDLSWEICRAFAALGYYPPVHFCDLPSMAGMKLTGEIRRTLDACKESCRIMSNWMENRTRKLDELEKSLKSSAA